MKGYPKSKENLTPNKNGYYVYGQNIKRQYPQKILLNETYLHKVDKNFPILAYTSSVGEIGIIEESFYRSGDNGAFQGLFSIVKLRKKELLYVLTVLKKQFFYFDYATCMANIMNLKFSLPTKNNQIAFDFMERYISELEEERISELTAYLKVSGLEDYSLTKEEQNALDLLRSGKIKFQEFKITGNDGVFNVNNTHSILQSWIVENSGEIPYVTAGESNNSITTYISYDKNCIEPGNSIMIGGKTLVITYQEKDYVSNDSHNLALYLKQKIHSNNLTNLFLVSCLYKSLKHKYSWGDSISKTKIKKDSLSLPLNINNEIDYSFMQTYIKAIEKLVIKNVVDWKDKVINKTKEVINS